MDVVLLGLILEVVLSLFLMPIIIFNHFDCII